MELRESVLRVVSELDHLLVDTYFVGSNTNDFTYFFC
jgi:hypothetical protein